MAAWKPKKKPKDATTYRHERYIYRNLHTGVYLGQEALYVMPPGKAEWQQVEIHDMLNTTQEQLANFATDEVEKATLGEKERFPGPEGYTLMSRRIEPEWWEKKKNK